jgi:alkyl hydroperoxide reductase subunit AhpF
MMQKILGNPQVKGITNIDLLEIKGDKFVTGLVYKDKKTDKII